MRRLDQFHNLYRFKAVHCVEVFIILFKKKTQVAFCDIFWTTVLEVSTKKR